MYHVHVPHRNHSLQEGKAAGRPQKTPPRRRAQFESDSARSSSLPLLPIGSGPLLPSDIARHGELYSCVSFTNVPQWVGLNTVPWNAYRIASQAGDRNAQRQAVEDLLMLPQRVLTRTKRGGGDGRRLTATVRARCRAVGEELRRHYRCPIPRDDTVRLSVATAPLAHVAVSEPSEIAILRECEMRAERARRFDRFRIGTACPITESDLGVTPQRECGECPTPKLTSPYSPSSLVSSQFIHPIVYTVV